VLVAAAAVFVAAFVSVLPAGAAPAAAGSLHYVVHPDPRLCPSPRCGGYWVALVNHARTRCVGGTLRPRCYVARAEDEQRRPLAGIPDGALVRGTLAPWPFDGAALGVLVAADVRAPAGRPADAPFFRVRDTGTRCVKAPCFFLRAWRVSTPSSVTVSELVLDAARLTPAQTRRAQAALGSKTGLFLAGRIMRASDGGRSLQASAVYLSP
jgi:hypothetical protein